VYILSITVDKKGQFERILTEVEMPMYLIKHHAMKIKAVNIHHCTFLTLALDGGRWSFSDPSVLSPEEESSLPSVQEARWTPGPLMDP
jgi:hypothetical protein